MHGKSFAVSGRGDLAQAPFGFSIPGYLEDWTDSAVLPTLSQLGLSYLERTLSQASVTPITANWSATRSASKPSSNRHLELHKRFMHSVRIYTQQVGSLKTRNHARSCSLGSLVADV